VGMRGQDIGDRCADVSVKQRQNSLDKRQRRTQRAYGALQAGRQFQRRTWRGKRVGQRAAWRKRGREPPRIAMGRRQGRGATASNRERGSDRGRMRLVRVRSPAAWASCSVHAKTL
jgi:hypothetical protein